MTKQLGLGVMIRMLGGNESTVKAVLASIDKKIETLALEEDQLRFAFTDGSKLVLFDNGQSCCESRYMRTDDDLSHYVGGKFKSAEIREAPEQVGEYGDVHEVQFLVVKTTRGNFTMSSHNEHNGYYGGFSIEAHN